MEIKYNIEKSQRKALAQKIAEIIGAEVEYLGVPSCAYEIDIFTLSKDAVLSFTDRNDTEIVEKVLNGLAEAGYTSETVTPPEGTDAADEPEEADAEPEPSEPNSGFPLNASISFPLADHTVQSLTNLICMIHSRGTLLSKATGGNFSADKSLADEIGKHEFRSVHELIAFIREWGETNQPLNGISFDSDKLTFDGFGEAQDADHVQTFMKLAGAMNRMALTQKRVQAKDVDDSNEKYSLRVWLIRLGLNGADFKADRKRLMENLSGHSAFRNDAERERWEAKQFPNERQLQALRERYPAGTKIRLNHMDDLYAPVPDGTVGEVQYIDDAGNIHMVWENGRTLSLIEGADSFTIIKEEGK